MRLNPRYKQVNEPHEVFVHGELLKAELGELYEDLAKIEREEVADDLFEPLDPEGRYVRDVQFSHVYQTKDLPELLLALDMRNLGLQWITGEYRSSDVSAATLQRFSCLRDHVEAIEDIIRQQNITYPGGSDQISVADAIINYGDYRREQIVRYDILTHAEEESQKPTLSEDAAENGFVRKIEEEKRNRDKGLGGINWN